MGHHDDAFRALLTAHRVGLTQAVLDDLRAKGIDVQAVHTSQQEVLGIRTNLISTGDAERASMVVCGDPPSAYPGEDILTWCHDCRCAIVHRPHAPRTPIKVCMRCARERLEQLGCPSN